MHAIHGALNAANKCLRETAGVYIVLSLVALAASVAGSALKGVTL